MLQMPAMGRLVILLSFECRDAVGQNRTPQTSPPTYAARSSRDGTRWTVLCDLYRKVVGSASTSGTPVASQVRWKSEADVGS
jgi:hypothetical protein